MYIENSRRNVGYIYDNTLSSVLGISQTRTSSVRASKFSELMYINREQLFECFEKHPGVIQNMQRTALTRYEAGNHSVCA